MKKVFKYQVGAQIGMDGIIVVQLPQGAKPLHFGEQLGRIFLWALVDPSAPLTTYKFRMAGTGHPIDTVGDYINTLIMQEDQLVFHFFFA